MTTTAKRRALLVLSATILIVLLSVIANRTGRRKELVRPTPTTPDAALAELRAGNARFVASRRMLSTDTEHDAEDRHILVNGQHPYAAVLCCADSRLCPEFIFDQRAGSLFELRNAGNLVDDDVMGSLEYAVEHLHIRLILVLGHKGCGAIKAIYEAGDAPLRDHLRTFQDHTVCIRQQLKAARDQHDPDVLDRLSRENTRGQARTLLTECEPLKTAIQHGELRIVCGMYDMESGEVDFYELH